MLKQLKSFLDLFLDPYTLKFSLHITQNRFKLWFEQIFPFYSVIFLYATDSRYFYTEEKIVKIAIFCISEMVACNWWWSTFLFVGLKLNLFGKVREISKLLNLNFDLFAWNWRRCTFYLKPSCITLMVSLRHWATFGNFNLENPLKLTLFIIFYNLY